MSHLGERLRQAREEQGLSLAQAATDTRIRQQSLLALEEGQYHRLPNDVVVKGFLRNYAQLLHLPVDEIIEQYRLERGGTQPIRVVPTSTMPDNRAYVLPSLFGVFFGTMVLVALTYLVLSAAGRISDANFAESPPAPTASSADTATPTVLASGGSVPATAIPPEPTATAPLGNAIAGVSAATTVPSTPTQRPVAGAVRSTPTPTASPSPAAPIFVEVSVETNDGEGSWLRVQTDGNTVYEQIMSPGEAQVFLAQRRIRIRSGNPTFVQVSVNGLPPERLGQVPGEPVDWSWPPE